MDKTCIICEEIKPKNKFHGNYCNSCHYKKKTEKAKKDKEKDIKKICNICNIEKSCDEFESCRLQCIKCRNLLRKGLIKKDKNSLSPEYEKIRKIFIDIKENKTYEELIYHNKLLSIKNFEPKYSHSYYINKIYNPQSFEELKELDLELVFLNKNKDEKDMFDYIRNYTSSMPQNNGHSKSICILVRDKKTKKYLGVLRFNSATKLSAYFEKINYKHYKDKKSNDNLNSILNMTVCVPVQPFGYNFCGGKLLSSLAFSSEICEHYNKKYGGKLTAICTTSLDGKGVQYKDVENLEYLEETTQGIGTDHIPEDLYQKILKIMKRDFPEKCQSIMSQHSNKLKLLTYFLKIINLHDGYLIHGKKRGIYFGYTGYKAKDFLYEKCNYFEQDLTKKTKKILNEWLKNPVIEKRYNSLIERNMFKKNVELFELNTEEIKEDKEEEDKEEEDKKEEDKEKKEEDKEKNKDKKEEDKEEEDKNEEEDKKEENEEEDKKEEEKEEEKEEQEDKKEKEFTIIKNNYVYKKGYTDIYTITNKQNDKQYIGVSKQIYGRSRFRAHGYLQRWNSHLKELNQMKDKNSRRKTFSTVLNQAIDKYGVENFEIVCLAVCKEKYTQKMEEYFIKNYDTKAPKGYNLTDGGDGIKSFIHSEEAIEKMRQANIGNKNCLGRKWSKEQREKMSGDNHHARKYGISDEARKKMSDAKKGKKGRKKPPEEIIKIKIANIGKKRIFTQEQFWQILELKNSGISQSNICKKITNINGNPICRSTIANIWNGKISLLLNSSEEEIKKYKEYFPEYVAL